MIEKDLQKEILVLKAELKRLKKGKQYGLVWEDKPEDVVLQCGTDIPLLKEVKSKKVDSGSEYPNNFLIEGDNYHALVTLNYTHKGRIDFIYIDPPYNTGARDWRYNNDYVDGEDPYRHTKWISFMNHRLKLAKDLLADDGIICVTIDDYEAPRLWMLLEDIFGRDNHLGTVVIRNNPKGRMTQRKFSLVHEYGIYFGKTQNSRIKKLPVEPEDKSHNYIQDKDGTWYLPVNLRKQGVDSNATNRKGELLARFYPIYLDSKTGKISTKNKYDVEILPIDNSGQKRIWRRSKDAIDEMYASGDLIAKKVSGNYQIYFKFRGGLDGRLAQSIWHDAKFSASEYGTRTLDTILGVREVFQFPKSPHAVKESILSATDKKDAVILDFFAGSGTTAQAVLELNKEDGGNRKFILCTNNENNICEEVTYARVKKVIKGYGEDKVKNPGNLSYYKTDFVSIENLHKIPDDAKVKVTYEAGEMIAVREDTLNEVEKNEWWQIFEGKGRITAIYFKEDKSKLGELIEKLEKKSTPVALYIFSWGKNEYKGEYSSINIRVEDIPEPILEVYKEINRL
jgi:adenine-specific DNA-methyltransferase